MNLRCGLQGSPYGSQCDLPWGHDGAEHSCRGELRFRLSVAAPKEHAERQRYRAAERRGETTGRRCEAVRWWTKDKRRCGSPATHRETRPGKPDVWVCYPCSRRRKRTDPERKHV